MTKKNANSRTILKLSRCLRRFPNGSRCRLPIADQSSYYCERHAHLSQPGEAPLDLFRELSADVDEFTSASDVNQFLSNLLRLLSQDRISPRRGAVLAYTCNLLLHTLRAIQHELEAADSAANQTTQIIFDMPRPDCERQAPMAAEPDSVRLAPARDIRASEPGGKSSQSG